MSSIIRSVNWQFDIFFFFVQVYVCCCRKAKSQHLSFYRFPIIPDSLLSLSSMLLLILDVQAKLANPPRENFFNVIDTKGLCRLTISVLNRVYHRKRSSFCSFSSFFLLLAAPPPIPAEMNIFMTTSALSSEYSDGKLMSNFACITDEQETKKNSLKIFPLIPCNLSFFCLLFSFPPI